MRGQKDLRTVKKEDQQDRKSRRKLVLMLQNGQMTDFCEKLDQL